MVGLTAYVEIEFDVAPPVLSLTGRLNAIPPKDIHLVVEADKPIGQYLIWLSDPGDGTFTVGGQLTDPTHIAITLPTAFMPNGVSILGVTVTDLYGNSTVLIQSVQVLRQPTLVVTTTNGPYFESTIVLS